jgi:hypothetical protein
MSIVKTARPLQIGDEILPWVKNDEEYSNWENKVKEAENELKGLPQGSKSITYLMKKAYKDRFSQNSKILYKKSINKFDYKTGAPDYKDHFLKFNWGIIRTSNYEEIAYLEMHPEWFIREANRELTPQEKLAKENAELKAKLESYENQSKVKALEELNSVNKEISEEIIFREEPIKEEIKTEKRVKDGNTRKTQTRKKRTGKSSNSK